MEDKSVIPEAPPAPIEKPQNCKIVIAAGKLNEGYCIVGDKLKMWEKPVPRIGKIYILPGTDMIIDKTSAFLFFDRDIKAFVAVPRLLGSNIIKIKGKVLYVLHPLKKNDYERYENKQMDASEVEMKYISPKIKGEGAYGMVEFHETSQVAIKRSKNFEPGDDLPADMIREIGIYRLLKEISCLPKLFGFSLKNTIKLEFELGIGTLKELIETTPFSEKSINIMFRLSKCLRASASQGIIHCDLKPENCIISRQGNVQIIDWGLARIDNTRNQEMQKSLNIQTLWWRAPEILYYNIAKIDGKYSNKIDIFSLGLMFAQMYNSNILIEGSDEFNHSKFILKLLVNIDPKDKRETMKELVNSVK